MSSDTSQRVLFWRAFSGRLDSPRSDTHLTTGRAEVMHFHSRTIGHSATPKMAAWQMPTLRHHATLAVMLMESHKRTDRFRTKRQGSRWLDILYDVEMYFSQNGCSDFEYDEELDVFRFPKDGRFAFCREFADWDLLRERGYLVF
jgi:hypothetical protein